MSAPSSQVSTRRSSRSAHLNLVQWPPIVDSQTTQPSGELLHRKSPPCLLTGLRPSLTQELVVANCRGTLGRIPLFRKLSIDFLAEVFPLAKPQSFVQGETIFAQGTVANELHFILDGEVELLSDALLSSPAFSR